MVDRAQRAIERAECAIVVIDGKEGLTDGDKRIAKIAFDAGKACVFAVNKWDLMEPEVKTGKLSLLQKDFTRIIRDELPELTYASVVFTSCTEHIGLEPVLDCAMNALENYSVRIPTGPLNRLIGDAAFSRPYTTKGRALKIYYATQGTTRPPTFSLFCNDPELMHFSYQRYIMNKIREAYPMPGTPIRLILKASHKDRAGVPLKRPTVPRKLGARQ
jgi:GTP-binding protein